MHTIARVAAAPSANIFANREYEMLLRSLNVRRLSFILFAGDKNQFLTQLPTIMEKLVEVLRTVSSPVVQSEVFLCTRVLLCRLSPRNLTGFWPTVLTELVCYFYVAWQWKVDQIVQYRIFEQAIVSMPSDGSEDLQLVLAACKCLDLLLVLQTEEFQMWDPNWRQVAWSWLWLTDTNGSLLLILSMPFTGRTIGTLKRWWSNSLKWLGIYLFLYVECVFDAKVLTLTIYQDSSTTDQAQPHLYTDQQALRRPLLNSLRQIESMRDLVHFFSNISISSYESMYASSGNIDWEAVEKGIVEDMFDGR